MPSFQRHTHWNCPGAKRTSLNPAKRIYSTCDQGLLACDFARQQWQLSHLARFTNNLKYLQGPLNAVTDALSCPPQEEAGEVCAVDSAGSPGQWNEKELLPAQLEDHQRLVSADRLVADSDFSWAEKRGGGPLSTKSEYSFTPATNPLPSKPYKRTLTPCSS